MSSSCVPRSVISPSFSTTIWSAFFTVLRRCATMTTVLSLKNLSRFSCITFSLSVSSAFVASSKTGNRDYGKWRAIRMRCFCPWLNPCPVLPILVLYFKGKDSMNSRIFAISTAYSRRSLSIMLPSGAMLLAMVSPNMNPSCITTPQCLRHSLKLIFVATDCLSSPLLRWEDRIRASVLSALFSHCR